MTESKPRESIASVFSAPGTTGTNSRSTYDGSAFSSTCEPVRLSANTAGAAKINSAATSLGRCRVNEAPYCRDGHHKTARITLEFRIIGPARQLEYLYGES